MRTQLARWRHRLQGRRALWQYYATIHAVTCSDCLAHHGRIFTTERDVIVPPLHAGCRCELLEFPVHQLGHFQARAETMRAKAEQERRRRSHMAEATTALVEGRSDAMLAALEEALAVDVYLVEIEQLCERQAPQLAGAPELAREVRDRLVKAYRYKYQADRYRFMPQRMVAERTDYGVRRIRALFAEWVTEESAESPETEH